jgi:hypothetical protein
VLQTPKPKPTLTPRDFDRRSISMDRRTAAVNQSMLLLQLEFSDRIGSQHLGRPMPEPLLVCCGYVNISSVETDELLRILQLQGGHVSWAWAKAFPPPPEHPLSNTPGSIQARQAHLFQQ